jgi:hypothetical protein
MLHLLMCLSLLPLKVHSQVDVKDPSIKSRDTKANHLGPKPIYNEHFMLS